MRRIVMWFMSTLTAVVLLFGYHTSTSGPSSANSSVVSSSGAGYRGSLSGTTSSSSGASSGSTSSGSTGTPSGASTSSSSKTVTGDTVQTRWGPVQVQITVSSGKITAVDVPVYPNGNPRDEEINAYALPTLVQETLDQQNANIDMVSGATVTSDGYLQSLQSALDQAGL
ncbi:MAG TPA: FMN-binding protein [Marmoricola sp.]|nr:FMN-binding protein [Marmoricola sp.]